MRLPCKFIHRKRLTMHWIFLRFGGTTSRRRSALARKGLCRPFSDATECVPPLIAIRSTIHMVARRMKIFRVAVQFGFLFATLCLGSPAFASANGSERARPTEELNPPQFEVSVESAYLLGFINALHSYEIGAVFVTGRMRWGVIDNDSWLRGYNQVYLTAMGEPILRGIENHYFGGNIGMRYNFVRPYWRLVPYISGGLGAGVIDSRPSVRGGQGQDFTFNILAQVGVSYEINKQWKLNVGVLYQHLSNAEQTDPNPSLNLIGPQVGLTYSF